MAASIVTRVVMLYRRHACYSVEKNLVPWYVLWRYPHTLPCDVVWCLVVLPLVTCLVRRLYVQAEVRPPDYPLPCFVMSCSGFLNFTFWRLMMSCDVLLQLALWRFRSPYLMMPDGAL